MNLDNHKNIKSSSKKSINTKQQSICKSTWLMYQVVRFRCPSTQSSSLQIIFTRQSNTQHSKRNKIIITTQIFQKSQKKKLEMRSTKVVCRHQLTQTEMFYLTVPLTQRQPSSTKWPVPST